MVTKIIKHVSGNKNDKEAKYYYSLYFAPLKVKIKIPKSIGDLYFGMKN